MENKLTVKTFFAQENVKTKFQEMLGKKAQGFITSVLQIVSSSELLVNAEPSSVYNAAAIAATLDLPLNNALGMAYIIPFNQKQKDGSYKTVAQFQLGYKSYIQLAQRSGLFKTISASPIYEGQLIESNPLTGYKFDFTQNKSDKIIGYAAYFELLNGFQKTLYMTLEELKKHGKKFSQTYKKNFGLWETDFEAMAIKTVIKLLLSKFAPLSIEMQKAVISDQSVINNADTLDVSYSDNTTASIDEVNDTKESDRIKNHIKNCTTLAKLEEVEPFVEKYNLTDIYNKQKEIIINTPETKETDLFNNKKTK
ncbi:MAG: recombinase RecT [Sulfurimonas sp.]|jgi:recombination protein RecT